MAIPQQIAVAIDKAGVSLQFIELPRSEAWRQEEIATFGPRTPDRTIGLSGKVHGRAALTL
jgi:hypothetical protein